MYDSLGGIEFPFEFCWHFSIVLSLLWLLLRSPLTFKKKLYVMIFLLYFSEKFYFNFPPFP